MRFLTATLQSIEPTQHGMLLLHNTSTDHRSSTSSQQDSLLTFLQYLETLSKDSPVPTCFKSMSQDHT